MRDFLVVAVLLGLLALAIAGDPQPGPQQGEQWRMPSLPPRSSLLRLTPGYWVGLPFAKTAEALCRANHQSSAGRGNAANCAQ